MDSTGRSVISVLTDDHRQVEGLLVRLRDASDPEERRRVLDEVTTAMVQHAAGEETVLYPAVREALPYGVINVEKEIAVHVEIKEALWNLEETDAAGSGFEALVTDLIAKVHQSVVNEENGVFPWFAQCVGERELIELGARVQALRETRPGRASDVGPAE
jgi:hemerythrin-like domain-containing protein